MQQVFDLERHKNLATPDAKRKRYSVEFLKASIKAEFNYCCAYCGSNSKRLTLDHVLAESKGGRDSWKNLVPACAECNGSKGSKNLTDWYTASLPFYSQERLQRILSRCGVKSWTFVPRCAKGFDPQV